MTTFNASCHKSLIVFLFLGWVLTNGVRANPSGAHVDPAYALEPLQTVFGYYTKFSEVNPITGYSYTMPVRPLTNITFAPLRHFFSTRLQKVIDDFLKADMDRVEALKAAGDEFALTGMVADLSTMVSYDPLTQRGVNPDKLCLSAPARRNETVSAIVQEEYSTERREIKHVTSSVFFVREGKEWKINEVRFVSDEGPGQHKETTLSTECIALTSRVREATAQLRHALGQHRKSDAAAPKGGHAREGR